MGCQRAHSVFTRITALPAYALYRDIGSCSVLLSGGELGLVPAERPANCSRLVSSTSHIHTLNQYILVFCSFAREGE